MSSWRFIKSVVDGQAFELGILNIWDYEWKRTGERISVNDPLHGELHSLDVYEIRDGNVTLRFAAVEFSNGVWGIYQEE